MSSPGTPGNPGRYDRGPEQHYDPITGQPVHPASGGYAPHSGGAGPQSFGSQYQGFGVFEQSQGQQQYAGFDTLPRSSGRKPVIVTMAIAAVVVVGIVAIVALTTRGSRPEAGPITDPTTSATTSDDPALQSSDPTTRPTAPTSAARATEDVIKSVESVVPGWQGLGIPEAGVAYDVPPGWVPKPGVISGFENDSGERVSMGNFAGFKEDFCAASDVSYRARVGTIGSDHADPVVAAKAAIRKWARLGWTTDSGRQPKIAMNEPRTVRLSSGNNTSASLVSATVTLPKPGPCGTPKVYLSVLGLNTDSDAALMLGMADQGVPGAVPPEDIDRSLTSLRPLPK